MKKIIFASLILSLIAISSATAQKVAFVDMAKILDGSPEYRKANESLEQIAGTWRQQIAQEYDKIKGMYNKYQAEQVLMSEDARKAKEDEIMAKEKEVRDMQKDKFGPDGALFKKRQELVRPLQDRIYSAIENYANERGYDFIFDKGTSGAIFSNAKLDKTDDILKIISK